MQSNEKGTFKAGTGATFLFVGLLMAYFLTFFFRVSASVVLPQLADEWGMSAALTGFISSMYFYAYALMQPMSGALNDKFGPSRIVAVGLMISGIGAIMFAFADGPLVLSIGRLLTGLGLAPMLSGALVYQGATFNPSMYAFFSGLIFFIGNLGAVSSVTPLGLALDRWGRSSVFIGLFAVTWVLAFLLFLGSGSDRIATAGKGKSIHLREIVARLKSSYGIVFSSKPLMSLLAAWTVMIGSLMSLQGLWAVSWSKHVYNAEPSKARLWATLIGIGVMAGSVIGALIKVDGRRRSIIIAICTLSYSLSWVALCISMAMIAPYWLTAFLAFLIGVIVGIDQPHHAASINELSPKGSGGSVFGAINMLVFASVIACQSFTGVVISRISAGAAPTSGAFLGAFGTLATLAIICNLVLPGLFVRDEGKRK
jgi:MFS family permease